MRTRKKIKRKRGSMKQNFPIDVVYKPGKKMFRGRLSKEHVNLKKDGKIILPKNYYSRGYMESVAGIHWNKLPKIIKPKYKLKKTKSKKSRKCRIKNQHGETISLPLEYPGNNVIHQDLNPERHKNIVLFDSTYFKKLYADYKKICD